MTDQDYELLSQLLDGELSADDEQALRQRLAVDPALRLQLQRMQQLNDELKSVFSRAGADAVPPGVAAMLAPGRTRKVLPLPRRKTSWAFALAASLVVSTGALLLSQFHTDSGPADTRLADTELAQLLEHSHSRADGWDALPDGRQFRSVLSFLSTSDRWCREYLVSSPSDGYWRAVACRENSGWVNEIKVTENQLGEDSSDMAYQYRPAAAIDSDEISDYMATHASDIALSSDEEAARIAAGWQ